MSLKTTIELPFGKGTAKCIVEIPIEAAGTTINGKSVNAHIADVTDADAKAISAGGGGQKQGGTDTTTARKRVSIIFKQATAKIEPYAFRVRRGAMLGDAMEEYAQWCGRRRDLVMFIANEFRLSGQETLEDLELDDGAEILAFY